MGSSGHPNKYIEQKMRVNITSYINCIPRRVTLQKRQCTWNRSQKSYWENPIYIKVLQKFSMIALLKVSETDYCGVKKNQHW